MLDGESGDAVFAHRLIENLPPFADFSSTPMLMPPLRDARGGDADVSLAGDGVGDDVGSEEIGYLLVGQGRPSHGRLRLGWRGAYNVASPDM